MANKGQSRASLSVDIQPKRDKIRFLPVIKHWPSSSADANLCARDLTLLLALDGVV